MKLDKDTLAPKLMGVIFILGILLILANTF